MRLVTLAFWLVTLASDLPHSIQRSSYCVRIWILQKPACFLPLYLLGRLFAYTYVYPVRVSTRTNVRVQLLHLHVCSPPGIEPPTQRCVLEGVMFVYNTVASVFDCHRTDYILEVGIPDVLGLGDKYTSKSWGGISRSQKVVEHMTSWSQSGSKIVAKSSDKSLISTCPGFTVTLF